MSQRCETPFQVGDRPAKGVLQRVKYCCQACQKEDWNEHKNVCKDLALACASDKHESAMTRLSEGCLEGCRRQFERAVKVQKELEGGEGDDFMMASSLMGLGIASNQEGRPDVALEKGREALAIIERVGGERSHHAATAHSIIGNAHMHIGRYGEALRELELARAIQVRELGPQATKVAETTNNIANLHMMQKNYPAAFKGYTGSLKIMKATLGVDHFAAGETLGHIADVLHFQGKHAEPWKCSTWRRRRATRRRSGS
mmetsp:Transcript_69/g.160  ORF Transcript_69/g.160 Transcript_69/m.160 type:complete len:258 (+) Transcript_69:43-816(+)